MASRAERCETCRFFEPNTPEKTLRQQWEEDTRPELPRGIVGLWCRIWSRAQFRVDEPTDIWAMRADSYISNRNQAGRCRRFPRSVEVSRRYGCGEYQAAPTPNTED